MGNFFESDFSIPDNVDLIEFGKNNLAYSMMKSEIKQYTGASDIKQYQLDIGFWTGFLTKTLMEQGKNSKEAIAEVGLYQIEIRNTLLSNFER